MSAASYQPVSAVQLGPFRLVGQFGNGRRARHRTRPPDGRTRRGRASSIKLGAHARRRVRVGEEDRAERDVRRTARDQLERVASVSARRPCRRSATRSRVARRGPRRARPVSAPVPSSRRHRVRASAAVAASSATPRSVLIMADAVGACLLDRADRLAHVPGMRRNLGVERLCGHLDGTRARSPPPTPAPRRRSGSRGSARCTRRRRASSCSHVSA